MTVHPLIRQQFLEMLFLKYYFQVAGQLMNIQQFVHEILILMNFLADLMYLFLDPRVSYKTKN